MIISKEHKDALVEETKNRMKDEIKELKEKILKKMKKRYWDKNEGWENGYMEECIFEVIEETKKAEREKFLKFIKEVKELYYHPKVTYANWKKEINKLAGKELEQEK